MAARTEIMLEIEMSENKTDQPITIQNALKTVLVTNCNGQSVT